MWPNRKLLDLIGIELPIIQAPMAGANGAAMAIAVSDAGGLGSLPCAMLDPAKARAEIGVIRQQTSKPLNVNFFCHTPPQADPVREAAWRERLAGYYAEFGLDTAASVPAASRAPFDEAKCEIVEDLKPEVVSFHFGLPARALLDRVKAAGSVVIASATTVAEARWLDEQGCDAIIAQGFEAGGHRGMFLSDDVATQVGSLALVPQVVDAVTVPVIAAGGIGDGRGIAADRLSLHAGSDHFRSAPCRAPGARQRRDGLDQPVFRPAGPGLGEPAHAGDRTPVRGGAGLPDRRQRPRAAEGPGGGGGAERLLQPLVGPSRGPRSRSGCRRADSEAGQGRGAAPPGLDASRVSNTTSCDPRHSARAGKPI
jgi:nitronate monooxygenase